MTHAPRTFRQVIDQLSVEGWVSEQQYALIEADLASVQHEAPIPWYLQAFIAIGAWLAALFFLAAVLIALILLTDFHVEAQKTLTLGLGIVVLFAALGLRRTSSESAFTINLALAMSLLGQALLLTGIGLISTNLTVAASVAIGVNCLLIVSYPDRVHRFLSSLIISGAALVLVAEWHIPNAIHVFLWLLALGSVWLWEAESSIAAAHHDELLRPIGYAMPTVLVGILGLALTQQGDVWPTDWRISTVGLLMLLLGWEYHTLSRYGVQKQWHLVAGVLVGTVLVLLPTLQAPGIAAAMLVFVIGFRRGNRILMGIAIAFLIGFFITFYYNLALTLFWKSLILMATGVVCLALQMIFKRFIWKPEVAV